MGEADKYQVVLADPAWGYCNRVSNGACSRHYETLTVGSIARLPVWRLAADNAALFLWVPSPMLDDGLRVVDWWGFAYKTIAFVWSKLTMNRKRRRIGPGNYTRPETEVCLLGIRGRMPVADHKVRQTIDAPWNGHSRKPDEQYDRIERLYPGTRKLEMFARPPVRDGWDTWGNEVETSNGAIELER